MTSILRFIDHGFDLVFRLMRPFPALLVLAILAVVATVFFLVVFRWTSNQKAIRTAKDRISAHILEIRLFPDQLSVVLRAYFALLGSLLTYLRHSLRPLVVLFVPLVILFVQMEAYFDRAPLAVGNDFLVSARTADEKSLGDIAIEVPPEILRTAPAVHIAADREVDWRLRAERPGTYEVKVISGGEEAVKRVVVGGGLRRVNWERESGGVWQVLLSQDEPPLPREGRLERIQVQYPFRTVAVWKWQLNWLVPFLIVMLVAALGLKSTLRTEF